MNRKLDKMEYLLANKSYEVLLPEEKEWIDQQYSSEEYTAMRMTLSSSTAFFKAERTSPNPEIKSRLKQRLQQTKTPAKVTPLFTYRIPAWQAIAAVALLLFFIPQLQEKPLNDSDKIFIYQTDTVFKTIPVETFLNPIVDTLTDLPRFKEILTRTNRPPIKSSTVVFSKEEALSASLSTEVSDHIASNYDSISLQEMINRYLKDSVKGYRVEVDTGFRDLGQVY